MPFSIAVQYGKGDWKACGAVPSEVNMRRCVIVGCVLLILVGIASCAGTGARIPSYSCPTGYSWHPELQRCVLTGDA